MKTRILVNYSLIVTALLLTSVMHAAAQGPSTFEFTENKGQWDKEVAFRGKLPTGNIYLNKSGFTIVQHNASDLQRVLDNHGQQVNNPFSGKGGQKKNNARLAVDTSLVVHSHAYKVQFIGGATDPIIVPDKVLPGYSNYILGNDPSKWTSNVKSYQAIVYKNVYPNIDVRYYSENGHLKYDLIVNPGGDVNNIAMQYEGADKLSIKNSELVIKTSVGNVRELYPYTYQFDNVNGKRETTCAYQLEGKNIVRFKTGNYSKTSTLVIDPSIVFSSFTGTTSDEWAFTATPGPDGSFFSAGIEMGDGLRVSPGAYKTTHSGGPGKRDIGIFKFNASGTARVYATYLGGDANDYPHSLICDAQGNLVILGRTYSSNYPGTLVGKGGGCDMVVTKLNATGTGLIGSLRIGGPGNDGVNIEDQMDAGGATAHKINSLLRNYGDDSHSEVILDKAGYIYVAGQSQSEFPMIGNGFQQTLKGAQDGVVLKINPDCNSIVWSTFLGGSGNDAAFVLALRPSTNEIYVSGGTESNDFPGITPGVKDGTVISDTLVGYIDAYVSIISNDGTTLQKSIYLGTKLSDIIYGIQFDRNNYPYVLGVTRGVWPVINAAYSVAGTKQFITKIQPDLSSIAYSTTFGAGSKPNISPVAFLVDRCENVYVSGWGGWYVPASEQVDPYDLAGVAGMPITPDALKSVTDNRDFYFIVLARDAGSLLYGSFFGQDGGLGEHVDGGTSRFDEQGVIYQAICANCYGGSLSGLPVTKNYQTTAGVWASSNGTGSSGCNLGALKISFNYSGVGSGPKAYFNGVFDTVGCVPFTVTFQDTVLDAKSYEWNFGDGSADAHTTTYDVTHTFTTVGSFRVRLIAIDSSTCNIRDTAYVTIHVRDDKANLNYTITKQPPCESLLYQFDNTTTFPTGKPFKASSFTWDFGDGTRTTPGPQSIQHSYAAPGTYKTRLILHDTAYCNSPDSLEKELRVSPVVDARFETPPYGCAPYTAVFNNTSLAGSTFTWNFGDGTTSTEVNPTHDYLTVGTYHVTLVVVDSNTCNIIDSAAMDINIYPKPVADFSFAPVPPTVNKPIIFTNLSTGAAEYRWYFGDGDSTYKNTIDTVSHQYNATGTFQACLVAYSSNGCTDTACKQVEALINPLLDVPTAFTPGRFGRNSYVTVAGFGIAKMNWRIYNRWGQIVFQTQDRKAGWDGTYKGQLQPMDVYAYTLDVEFSDGKTMRKTGDITLIR